MCWTELVLVHKIIIQPIISPTSSCVAEITLPFAGADRGSLRMSTDIFVFLSNVIA